MTKMFQWRSKANRVVRLRQLSENYHLTPALESAGYRVPRELLVREGYIQRAKRQAVEDEQAEKAARALEKAAAQLRSAAQSLPFADVLDDAAELVRPRVLDGEPEPEFDQ